MSTTTSVAVSVPRARMATCSVARLAILSSFAALLATVTTLPPAAAEPARVSVNGQSYAVRFTAQFDANSLTFGQSRNYDTVVLTGESSLREPGSPMLPMTKLRIALPEGMTVTGAKVAATKPVELAGKYSIMPAQRVQRMSDPPQAFVSPDQKAYSSAAPYPADLIRSVHQSDLAGQNLAAVEICPLQYVPATGKLILNTNIEIVVEGTAGYVCGDYLPVAASVAERNERVQQVGGMVLNPEDVQLVEAAFEGGSRGVSMDDYEYVIITDAAWVSAFQPLIHWKLQKGMTATIVTTDWIYNSGGYTGDDNVKLRTFIGEAYLLWGTRYILLGGDTNVIPTGLRHVIDDDIPNDTFYADFDDDMVCEVNIGRAPARSAADVTTFVNKSLVYQKTPPANFGNTAAFFGFDLNQPGSAEGEDCKTYIRETYLPTGWTFHAEYDSQSGSHMSDTIGYLNQGHNLTNHIDHSSTDSMGAGGTDHWDYMSTSTIAGLTNGARQGLLYSIGCWACDFNADICIAEAFVRNAGGGGVAFIGNSRYGWYVPYDSDGASAHWDRYFFRSLFEHGQYRLGDCFSDHKNDAYVGGEYDRYLFTELTLLGDPEMPIWTASPAALNVMYPASISPDTMVNFAVTVTSGGSPVPDATVVLWKTDEVYLVGQTDSSGIATFPFYASSLGSIQITVTKRDYAPYEGDCDVISATGPYVLSILVEGQGDVQTTPAAGSYAPGTTIQIAAEPQDGWCFDHWENAATGTTTPTTLVMDANKIVIAVFALDCNANGVSDARDIASGLSTDCNENAVPDECDIATGSSEDCNENSVPDDCELAAPSYVEAADECADAMIICPGTIYYGTTVGATSDGEANCGGSGSPDVWYYFKTNGNGYLSVMLCGSSFDTVLSVHSGCPGTSANQLACNNDYCGLQSKVTIFARRNRTYWLRVAGIDGAAGDFQMSATGPACYYDLTDLDHDGVLDECQTSCLNIGDANCDGAVNTFDIDPFVAALTNPTLWTATYTCDYLCANDCNGDGAVDSFDIDPFVTILTGSK